MKVISGGQSGVDRAALDAAIEAGLEYGGWCPKGRVAEDGIIPSQYKLIETPSSCYEQRTEWNIRDADATLVVLFGEASGGTAYTIDVAKRMGKPLFIISADDNHAVEKVVSWIRVNCLKVLNVAGPRASFSPQVYLVARKLLSRIFDQISKEAKNG